MIVDLSRLKTATQGSWEWALVMLKAGYKLTCPNWGKREYIYWMSELCVVVRSEWWWPVWTADFASPEWLKTLPVFTIYGDKSTS